MKLTRGSVLAGLAFVVVVAPVAAYAVSADDDSDHAAPFSTHGPTAPHPSGSGDDDAGPLASSPGIEHADDASAPGRAHADAMKAWARCVAEAASGPKVTGAPIPPKLACGDKPVGPGRAVHAPTGAAPGHRGEHRPAAPPGHAR